MTRPDLAVVDVETTGFAYKKHDRIVEVGVVRSDPDGVVQTEFETLVNPERDVGPTHIHGVTAEMVRDAPRFEEVAGKLLELLEGTCFVAHNATFDVNFLRAEFDRAGVPVDEVPYCCTLSASRSAFPDLPSKQLEKVCQFLDIDLDRAHTALSDARATRRVFDRIRSLDPDAVSEPSHPFLPDAGSSAGRAEPFPRDRFEEVRSESSSPIGRLMHQLPSVDSGPEETEAYASLLHEVLMDRIITEEEYEALASLAQEYRIAPEDAEEIHRRYLKNLIRYTLLDREVSERERKDLEKVQSLLDLGDEDLDEWIAEVREDLDRTYAGDPSDVDEELKGSSVCFTGSLTCKLDGDVISRSTAQQLAEENGMVIKNGVTKSLDYLVAADPHSQSNKAEKARKYGIPILAELAFWRKLGVQVS